MDEAQLRDMLAGGESLTVEFKSEWRGKISDHDLVAAVACLANGRGGYLLLGVEDDGSVTGARPRHEQGSTDPYRVQALIANSTVPPVRSDVELAESDSRPVLVIHVEKSERVVGTSQGFYTRRTLGGDGRPACVPFHAHEMLAHEIERGAIEYATLPVPAATWADLDPLEFARFRRLVREAGGDGDSLLAGLSDEDIASALGLARADRTDQRVPLLGALLLFGTEAALRRFVPTHEAAFHVLSGHEVTSGEHFRWPLYRLADELFSRFKARNTEREIESGLLRIRVPAFAETAFREALANALIHRDYTRMGAVHVRWGEDALEISNPGGFPPGVRVDNLLVVPPRPRNPLLADAFKRAGIVERTGRGVGRIFEAQLRFGRDAPDYGRSSDDSVVAVLPGGPANLALTAYVLQLEASGTPLSLPELQVTTLVLQVSRVTTREVATLIQRTDSEARSLLGRMVARGLIEARGEGKGRTYHLAPAVYRALDARSGYVRTRSFDPIQQESMVLAYVQAHGRITRREAADLCALTSEQARQLLSRLTAEGKLQRFGERRGAYYESPT